MTDSTNGLSALKLSMLAKDVRAKAGGILSADPIAVVGMSCRVPGADSPDAYWEVLAEGRDTTSEVPADRWDNEAWYDPEVATPGKSSTRRGGFLDQIDGFDATFFNILPREADTMDPQQRLFLECAIEALDDAGQVNAGLRGSRTGVFVASYHCDYAGLSYRDLSKVDLRTLTGTVHSVVPNRLSYLLDLRGPSVSIDTACSSSLVAIHMACQSLRGGESDLAIAGGVSLMITPDLMVSLSKVGFMAPDGRSKAFDSAADGFGRGEGCGVMVLRRLSDAIAEGNQIHAVIRGSAVNQDGESTLLTAPNGPAQEALIREALDAARVDGASISFIEAHGTGTALGDPIEVGALASTVGIAVEDGAPCYVGTAKANIGHLEAAAGVVGAIKSVLTLKHRVLPPQPLFETLNPNIDLAGTRLKISKQPVAFDPKTVLRCGVSGFGVGGTNAHVVLEEAPRLAEVGMAEAPVGPVIIPLTAKSTEALDDLARKWSEFLRSSPDSLNDIAFTASERRTHYTERLAVVGHDKDQLAKALSEATETGFSRAVLKGTAKKRKLAMVFCGQGPQWFAMGQELASSSPSFRAALEECDAALATHWDTSLKSELSRGEDDTRLQHTEIAQPALFAIQVALARMWMARGVIPDAVTGHSVGEIAALHIAGVIDLATAARIVVHRGRIMQQADGTGAMVAVGVSKEEALRRIGPFEGELSLAAVNSPRTCVLSGVPEALDKVIEGFVRDGVEARRLPVRYAFHSVQMEPFVPDLCAALEGIGTTSPSIRFISTVTGKTMEQGFTAEYFARNMCEPVRFAAAIEELAGVGHDCFLEIGPHPVLGASIAETVNETEVSVIASLRRNLPDAECVAMASAALFVAGVEPDWTAFGPEGKVVPLPSYPWQRRRHWLPDTPAVKPTGRRQHPVLTRRSVLAPGDVTQFEGDAGAIFEWCGDHVIFERTLLPGAAIIEGFLAVARELLGDAVQLYNLTLLKPVEVTNPDTSWQIVARRISDTEQSLEWFIPVESGWDLAATALCELRAGNEADELPTTWPTGEPSQAQFERSGLGFGASFRLLSDIRIDQDLSSGIVSTPPGSAGHILHPAVLDAAFQLALIAAEGVIDAPEKAPFVPVAVSSASMACPSDGPLKAVASVTERSVMSCLANVALFDASGACCARIEGLQLLEATKEIGGVADNKLTYIREWKAHSDQGTPKDADDWLLVDLGGSAETVRDLKQTTGSVFDLTVPDLVNREAVARAIDKVFRDVRPPSGVVLCLRLDPVQIESSSAAEAVIGAIHVIQSLLAQDNISVPHLRLLTRDAQGITSDEPGCSIGASVWGAMGALAIEHPEFSFRAIDADSTASAAALFDEMTQTGPAWTALRNGVRLAPRLERARVANGDIKLQRLAVTGEKAIEAIELSPMEKSDLGADEVRISVRCSGLNFRDVLLALGTYPDASATIGAECSGVVLEVGNSVTRFKAGERVMGMVPCSHAAEAVGTADLLVHAPDRLSDASAAGQPVAYLTASYGLEHLAGIKNGDSILIHAAAGGVGLAALRIAKNCGARIFATAGSKEKRAFVIAEGADHVFDSRKAEFSEEIIRLTDGRGVDIVLNSLAGEFISESLRATAKGGWFLELGKRGILTTEEVALQRPDINYLPYDLGEELINQAGLLPELMSSVIQRFGSDELQPLPVREFPLSAAKSAFRYMAEAKHIGKTVLRASHAPFSIDPEGVYWITGGLGAIGLDAARWLAGHGARQLVLTGRHDPDEHAATAISDLESSGVRIHVFSADAADRGSMTKVRERIDKLGILKGVVHAAGVLRDKAFHLLTAADVREVMSGKFDGAFLLDELTRDRPLDFMILLSGAGLSLGSPGQAAYLAANAGLDSLAHKRRSSGLPALSVALGPWQGGGMAANLQKGGSDVWAERGVPAISPAEGFAAIEEAMSQGRATATVAHIDWPTFLRTTPTGLDLAVFENFSQVAAVPEQVKQPGETQHLLDRLRAQPDVLRAEAMTDALAELAKKAIGLPESASIPPFASLKDEGLDSLMSVEFRNMLVRVGGVPLPVTLLFDHPTLHDLVRYLAEAWSIYIGLTSDNLESKFTDELSDDDILAELEAELAQSVSGGAVS
ncbi:type I polyketide synthase [Phaeobacter sp. 22II1-1F12B]|uniref:type I polyketide synthase n=1 Tax=Phaeobacter sp. 22II1-1F12B TaxID=1317111 RepID=UPI000B522103|nr:type I polyketide synthase [Phaeobacter sp. 22II1-1F12B]